MRYTQMVGTRSQYPEAGAIKLLLARWLALSRKWEKREDKLKVSKLDSKIKNPFFVCISLAVLCFFLSYYLNWMLKKIESLTKGITYKPGSKIECSRSFAHDSYEIRVVSDPRPDASDPAWSGVWNLSGRMLSAPKKTLDWAQGCANLVSKPWKVVWCPPRHPARVLT